MILGINHEPSINPKFFLPIRDFNLFLKRKRCTSPIIFSNPKKPMNSELCREQHGIFTLAALISSKNQIIMERTSNVLAAMVSDTQSRRCVLPEFENSNRNLIENGNRPTHSQSVDNLFLK
jgi:hypothetical protein